MLPVPLHPAIVHFPIAMMVLAPLVAIATLVAVRRGAPPRRAWRLPTGVLAALVFSAWIAGQGGERGNDRVVRAVAGQAVETPDAARRQLDEARAHYALVMPLIRNLHNGPAATEIVATADHVEGALRSGARLRGRARPGALAEVRGTAALLARQQTGVPATTGPALETLQGLLDSLTVQVGTPDTAPRTLR